MEKRKVHVIVKAAVFVGILSAIGGVAFAAGLAFARTAHADDSQGTPQAQKKDPRVVYPDKTELDFEGTRIEGEVRNPGEFYFQHRPEEKFDSLVKRRKNFHQQMLRDVVLSK